MIYPGINANISDDNLKENDESKKLSQVFMMYSRTLHE